MYIEMPSFICKVRSCGPNNLWHDLLPVEEKNMGFSTVSVLLRFARKQYFVSEKLLPPNLPHGNFRRHFVQVGQLHPSHRLQPADFPGLFGIPKETASTKRIVTQCLGSGKSLRIISYQLMSSCLLFGKDLDSKFMIAFGRESFYRDIFNVEEWTVQLKHGWGGAGHQVLLITSW